MAVGSECGVFFIGHETTGGVQVVKEKPLSQYCDRGQNKVEEK
jgi:hypothetical protein